MWRQRALCRLSGLLLAPILALAGQNRPPDPWEQSFNLCSELLRSWKLAGAQAACRTSLQIAESAGSQDPRIGASLAGLAAVAHARGELKETERLALRASRLLENAPAKFLANRLAALQALSNVYLETGRISRVRTILREMQAIADSHPEEAASLKPFLLHSLGMLHWSAGEHREAEARLIEFLNLAENDKTQVMSDLVPVALNNLAAMYISAGRFDEAERCILRSIALVQSSFGEKHVDVAFSHALLGAIYLRTRRLEEADRVLSRAGKIAEDVLLSDHPMLGAILFFHAEVLAAQKRNREAKATRERAEAILGAHSPDAHGRLTVDFELLMRSRK